MEMSISNGKPKICLLGMPSYGGPSMAAARAFYRARVDPATLKLSYQQASLLDSNCSALWCMAINKAFAGEPFAYFAMLHADVQPMDWWLDVLIDELEATGLDVLSVAVPIKDEHGLTSTALGFADLDDFWRPFGRITLRELHQLPVTFTAADTGHSDKPLLFNTGCFVCKFDLAWARQVCFASRTRIVFSEKRNGYVVEAEPEDWHFARDCHRQGLKVGVTRRLALSHRGNMDFQNDRPWGTLEYDTFFQDAPFIRPPVPDWTFPADVDGWLSEREGRALGRFAAGKRVLEIGSFFGRSTICLAQTAAWVDAVDPHDGRSTKAPQPTLVKCRANLRRWNVLERVRLHVGTFAEVAPQLSGNYDLIFIDGDHSAEAVAVDVRLALPLLAPGGLLAFHDYRTRPGQCDNGWDAGVTAMVDALIDQGGELLEHTDTVAVIRPPISEREGVNYGRCHVSTR